MKFLCVRGNTSRGIRTACSTDNSTRELFHGCLGHTGASRRNECQDARIPPSATESSSVGGKVCNTPGKSHVSDSASTFFALLSGRENEREEDVRCDVSQIELTAKWEADQGSA